ncbi:hypothetical protein [Streptomyces sediminimaris]|uniref:hypothetical protein n=1 Tax=Streptomyces sediminimaris TaxID=3383721 RepID=UPI00399C1BC9
MMRGERATATRALAWPGRLITARRSELTSADESARHLQEMLAESGVILLDGLLIRTRRRTGAQNRKNYSGKRKHHGPARDRAHR